MASTGLHSGYHLEYSYVAFEHCRDGSNDNFSWNCGSEGETSDQGILALRQKQMKNMLVALIVSQGTPMILAGKQAKRKTVHPGIYHMSAAIFCSQVVFKGFIN